MTTVCLSSKIDSNITGLYYAEEVCLKVLPTVAAGDGSEAVWYGLEPNSYSDFGGDLKTVARTPIDPGRQNKKGTVTDLDASGGFNSDFTKTNLVRLLQGFFFADIRQKPTSKAINAAQSVFTSVTGSSKTYTSSAGSLLPFNVAGALVFFSGFTNAANNGLKTVVSATATTIVVNETSVDEAAPPAAAVGHMVGFQFASADVNIALAGAIPTLTSTAKDFTTMGMIVGEWVYIGGDLTALAFANNSGYARISAIAAHVLTFDDVTWTPANETGTAKTVQLFFGSVLKNETTPSLIKRRSYNIERQLGYGINASNLQAEYLEGAVANEMTLNLPTAEKLNCDMTFVAAGNSFRSGDTSGAGDLIKVGTRNAAPGEDAINTSSNVVRVKMSVVDPTTANPAALFGYVTEANISINNGVTPNKAVGVLGAFDTSAGNFVVAGSLTAYFTTVAAVKAVRNNADVGFNIILAQKNGGFLFDIPLLGLGGGRVGITKDQPITVPLTPQGAGNKNGYTLLFNHFAYLPTRAVPS